MKKFLILLLGMFSTGVFAQSEANAVQEWYQNPIVLVSIFAFLGLLVSYIVALQKTKKGEMVVFVNMYDFILMFLPYILIIFVLFFAGFFGEGPIKPLYLCLIVAFSFACIITSMVWSVLANNKDVKLGVLAVLAKMFLVIISWILLLVAMEYILKKRESRGTYQGRVEYEEGKTFVLKIASILFLSLIVGTAAYKGVIQKNNVDEEKVNNLIQNVEIKKLLYTFLGVALITFCIGYGITSWYSSKNSDIIEEQVSNFENVDDTQTDNSQEEDYQWPPKSNSTPEFDEFFKKFNSDNSFQISRIVFPIKKTINDMGVISYETITKAKWEVETIDEKSDYYYVTKNVKGNKATIYLSGNENGISMQYHFEKRNGEWYLISFEDTSS